MSIEQSLESITKSLETIATVYSGGAPIKPAKPAKDNKPAKDTIPGLEDVADVTNISAATIKTPQELRDFAQKYLAAANSEQSPLLLKFIKEEVCVKLNKKEPKLITMPAENVGKAAQMIYDYCQDKGIILPGA
jgi:hypothetical protein